MSSHEHKAQFYGTNANDTAPADNPLDSNPLWVPAQLRYDPAGDYNRLTDLLAQADMLREQLCAIPNPGSK